MKKNNFFEKPSMVVVMLLTLLVFTSCSLPWLDSDVDIISENNSLPEVSEEEAQTSGEEISSKPTLEPTAVWQPKEGDTLRWVDASLLVFVPGGEFLMGGEEEDNPLHSIDLSGFWIYRTKVTNQMYLRCIASGKCTAPAVDPSIPDMELAKNADQPVVGVTWEQAMDYCDSVGGTLPTEAQWEKAARGPDGDLYPWGNEDPTCDLLNFNNCLGEPSTVLGYPEGMSPYELLDMAGNVFEWTADWYLEGYYLNSPQENPMGPDFGEERSVRGSTFRSEPDRVESSLRYHLDPEEYRSDLGFRCVVGDAETYAPLCEMLPEITMEVVDNPGDDPGGSASCVVPQPLLSVVTYCEDGERGNNISWSPADAEVDYSTIGAAWCSQYDADTLACRGEQGATVDIEVCRSCPPPSVELGVPGNCAIDYVLDAAAKVCRYAGSPIPDRVNCAPGYSLEEDDSCCALESRTPSDYQVCPVGGTFEEASNICWFTLPSTGDEKCTAESVFFAWCARDRVPEIPPDPCSKYGNPNECGMHPDACHWDFAQNACVGN